MTTMIEPRHQSAEETAVLTEVQCKEILVVKPQESAATTMSDFELLQMEHNKTLEALRLLAEGVRIVARQMRSQPSSDEAESVGSVNSGSDCDNNLLRRCGIMSSGVSIASAMTDDEKRLNDLTLTLQGNVGADLAGLSQAATMVNEHARLSSQEACVLTDDNTIASKAAEVALERAAKAEKAVKRLYLENRSMQLQLDNYKVERKVLAREVKSLRRENGSLRQFRDETTRRGMLSALETHVQGALRLHEEQLARKEVVPVRRDSEDMTAATTASTKATEPSKSESKEVFEKIAPDEVADAKMATAQKPRKRSAGSTGFNGNGLVGFGFSRPPQAPAQTPKFKSKPAIISVTDAAVLSTPDNKENQTSEEPGAVMQSIASSLTSFFIAPTTSAKPALTTDDNSVPASVSIRYENSLSPMDGGSPAVSGATTPQGIETVDPLVLRSLSLPTC